MRVWESVEHGGGQEKEGGEKDGNRKKWERDRKGERGRRRRGDGLGCVWGRPPIWHKKQRGVVGVAVVQTARDPPFCSSSPSPSPPPPRPSLLLHCHPSYIWTPSTQQWVDRSHFTSLVQPTAWLAECVRREGWMNACIESINFWKTE